MIVSNNRDQEHARELLEALVRELLDHQADRERCNSYACQALEQMGRQALTAIPV